MQKFVGTLHQICLIKQEPERCCLLWKPEKVRYAAEKNVHTFLCRMEKKIFSPLTDPLKMTVAVIFKLWPE